MNPKDDEFKKVNITVQRLTASTFNEWTDSLKWVCDTYFTAHSLPQDIAVLKAPVSTVDHFLETYPYTVGTFYVICDIEDFCKLQHKHPSRDLRLLLI